MKSTVVILALLALLVDTRVDAQCASTAFPLGLAFSSGAWGDSGACSGHLLAEDSGETICGFVDHRAAARACWELNIHTATLGVETQRRYRCAPYTGAMATALAVGDPYYDLEGGGTIGQSCQSGDPDCFMDCHAEGGTEGEIYAVGTTCDGNSVQTAITCLDIDECADGIDYDCTGPFVEDCKHRIVACGPNADCADTVGSYVCTCPTGYAGAGGEPFNPEVGCLDTDECDTADICGDDAVCENTPGSFICLCDAGYTWNDTPSPGTCDINECLPVNDIPNALLTPGGGDYGDESTYACNDGYEPSISGGNSFSVQCRADGTYCSCSAYTCERIRCGLPAFDPNAKTPITSGVFEDTLEYTCLDGFEAGGAALYTIECQNDGVWETPAYRCQDVNECDDDPCPTYSTCFNTIGSHLCICDPGYEGAACAAISCGAIPVVANAQITTTVPTANGMFGMVINYRCAAGYHVSFDEDPNSVLTNFDIECKQDECWSPQPIPQCVPVSCGDPGVVPYAKRSAGNFFFGDEISYTCVEGYRPSDYETYTDNTYRTFTINCGADSMWSPRPYCTDINECLTTNLPCGDGEGHICINKDGSYTCSCAAYYRLDQTGQNCIGFPVRPADVSEPCTIYESLSICNWGKCQYNSQAKPHCWCNEGYTGAFCDREMAEEKKHELYSLPFILSLVSLALAFFALLIAIIVGFCFCCCSHRRGPSIKHIDHHHADHAPIYRSSPPLSSSYPRAGFMMALRNKATNALYPMTH